MIAELISYQCLEVMPHLTYRTVIVEGKTFDVGSQHFRMSRVRLASNLQAIPVGTAVVKEGWMLHSALIGKSQIEAYVNQRQSEKK